ncbi:hypothetical protein DLAC_08308 [Tieghemostelium lacteum]|uniref:Uncharacterized protein n=1 Tax=Tieghemostelium lacteum TaxID=361077 RepID=A0A151ZBN5_TIELA|nr:hypothetical protein DLAC_08308 [Tieghemostelium lacteum]|eukprot:KYQ91356.1 hypothetical protein DLAC_08308 [Tieghemostelium lacteum]
MAFLLNYNFQIQSKLSNGLNNSANGLSFYVPQRSPPPPTKILSHFDDSFPLDNPYIKPMIKDEDDYKYSQNVYSSDDEDIFIIDDL